MTLKFGDYLLYAGEGICGLSAVALVMAFLLIQGVVNIGEGGFWAGLYLFVFGIGGFVLGGLFISGGLGYRRRISWAARLGSVGFIVLAIACVYWLVLFVPYFADNLGAAPAYLILSVIFILALVSASFGSLWVTRELWRAA